MKSGTGTPAGAKSRDFKPETERHVIRALQLYRDGHSIDNGCRSAQVNKSTVMVWLRAHGKKLSDIKPGLTVRHDSTKTPESDARCRKALIFIKDGYSVNDAAKHARTSDVTIRAYLTRQGKTLADIAPRRFAR